MEPRIDLSQLARVQAEPIRRPSVWKSRIALPVGVVGAFLALVAWSLRDALLPRHAVTVVPVVHADGGEAAAPAESPLFQSAGWVEPRPTATIVTAIAEGVVERLAVVEGQAVRSGEPIAFLVDRDAKLSLDEAGSTLSLRLAEEQSARATLTAAGAVLRNPLQRKAALAEADSLLAKAESELRRLPFQTLAAKARCESAKRVLEGKRAAGGAVAGAQLYVAESDYQAASAAVEELKEGRAALEHEVEVFRTRRQVLQQQLELLIDEKRADAEAAANLKSAEARSAQARTLVATAALRLERMTIRSPCAGRVLALVARPGTRLMGLSPASAQDASTVVTLYDPKSLQIRADVRLENVSKVSVGQAVRIETAAIDRPLEGKVLIATANTDVQKNTLQVKVAVETPPEALKPDMLVQATFLAPPDASGKQRSGSAAVRLFIPRSVVEMDGDVCRVWVVDGSAMTAARREVRLGRGARGDCVEAAEGLRIGDRLIARGREGIREGQRVKITAEEPAP